MLTYNSEETSIRNLYESLVCNTENTFTLNIPVKTEEHAIVLNRFYRPTLHMYTDAFTGFGFLWTQCSHMSVTWTAEEHAVKFKVDSHSGLAVRQQC